MNSFLFVAHSRQDMKNQAAFSILSLFQEMKDLSSNRGYQVVIYTDDRAFFEGFFSEKLQDIVIVETPPTMIEKWIAGLDYVHRVKEEVIQDLFRRYPGNLIYADTDTYFLKSPEPLFKAIANGDIFMHAYEGRIDRPPPLIKGHSRYMRENTFLYKGKSFRFPPSTEIWNAGVIGLSSRYVYAIDDALDLLDSNFKEKPYPFLEQLAVAYCLRAIRPLKPLSEYVYHYWHFKEFQKVIDHTILGLIGKSWQEKVNHPLPTELMPSFEEVMKFNFRVFRKLARIGIIDSQWLIGRRYIS